ncbi:MAG: flavin monoamine oxidase family protein, partial [Phenylobacterium sp.]
YSDGATFDLGALSADMTWKEVAGAATAWELRQMLPFAGLKDRSLGATIPEPSPAQRHLKNIWAVEMGEDPDRVSRNGYYALEAGEDLIPENGMGPLVKGLASNLNIRLNSPVTRLTWSEGHGVTGAGAFGQVRARKAIVTAPTGVLASGALRFDPALPVATQTAINNLPMGALEKVAMVLDRPIPDLPEYAISNSHVQQGQYHALLVSPDKQMITALIPGPMSRRLSAEGQPAMEAFALSLLKSVIGNAARVQASASTHWLGDAFALGSYPHQTVGHADARRIYSQPIEDRLFFAGDAGDDPLAVTVGGAWRQGEKAAAAVARQLRGTRR